MAFSYRDRWEMFYTNSLNDEELVDQIYIDDKGKRFILDIDVNEMETDGYDENSEPIYSTYVSRTVFDIIVDGIKQKKYVKYVGANMNDD